MSGRISFGVAIFLALYVGFTRPAYAYLDPGTGSIFLQIVIGGVAGTMAVLKIYWHRVKAIFTTKSKRGADRPGN